MTPVCFRLDLDSTPWDHSSGYGVEQSRLVALFDDARRTGIKFHVFASSRALRASPGLVDAVLGDGHDLDWLHTGPPSAWPEAMDEAEALIQGTGHTWWGVGVTSPFAHLLEDRVRFISAPDPDGMFRRPFETRRFCLGVCPADWVRADLDEVARQAHPVRTLRDWVMAHEKGPELQPDSAWPGR